MPEIWLSEQKNNFLSGFFMTVIEILFFLLFASFKFAIAFPIAVFQYKMNFPDIVLITSAGGILGVVYSTFLTHIIILLWNKHMKKTRFITRTGSFFRFVIPKRNRKKKFTRRNRLIILIRKKYGLAGISILTPVLLSIPIGTFIALRYYPNYTKTVLFLIVSVVGWSFIFTFFWQFFAL